jgi:transcriptional regulator with PAS, ATPase and Fis domain
LFGSTKGSFTGSTADRRGLWEEAEGGTLFLDEIGTLGLTLQSKLLRVLEQHVVQRIGSRTSKKIDFRLIAATNEDLEQAVRAGRFREDLYYRINVVPIALPPLRERPGDVAILLDHFLRMYSAANGVPLKRLDSDALEILEEYHWPGNVRELENCMERAVIVAAGRMITEKDLPEAIRAYASPDQISSVELSVPMTMEEVERIMITRTLVYTNGDKAKAARLLDIGRKTLYRKLEQYKKQ